MLFSMTGKRSMNMIETNTSHGDSLVNIEQTVRDERNKTNTRKDEAAQNMSIEKERILKSLREETKKLNISESKFDDWSSITAKDLDKLLCEETSADSKEVKLHRKRESNREELEELDLS